MRGNFTGGSRTVAATSGPTLGIQSLPGAQKVGLESAVPAALVPTPQRSPIRFALRVLTAIGLTPEAFPAGSPLAPIGRLLEFTYAALRRVDQAAFNQSPTAGSTSAPPTPDAKTGIITGELAVDGDGDQLTYTVTDPPKYGTLDIQQATQGTLTYTYTPDTTKSLTGNEADEGFTVVVSDDTSPHVHQVGGHETVVTVSNIDVLPNNVVVKTIDPGGDPSGIAINRAGNHVYVTDETTGQLRVIDSDPGSLTYNTVIQSVPVGLGAKSVTSVTRADGREFVYVATSYGDDDAVTPFENVGGDLVAVGTPLQILPGPGAAGLHDIEASPDGSKVYVSSFDKLYIINTVDNSFTTAPLEEIQSELAVSPTTGVVYASNYKGHVQVYDPATGLVTTPITAPAAAGDLFLQDVIVSPDGKYLYVSGDGIYKVDTATNTVVDVFAEVPFDNPDGIHDPRGISISPDGKRLYITEINFDDVLVVDTATGELIGKTSVDDAIKVVSTPDGTREYVIESDFVIFGGNPQVSVIEQLQPAVEA